MQWLQCTYVYSQMLIDMLISLSITSYLKIQMKCLRHSIKNPTNAQGTSYHTLQKEMVTLTLLIKVISVVISCHPTLSFYTLETDGMWAMCRVSSSSCEGLSGRAINDSPLVYRA